MIYVIAVLGLVIMFLIYNHIDNIAHQNRLYKKISSRGKEIEQLTSDIRILVLDEDVTKTTMVKIKYSIEYDMERQMWIGDVGDIWGEGVGGIEGDKGVRSTEE